jgi:hypothetical protein
MKKLQKWIYDVSLFILFFFWLFVAGFQMNSLYSAECDSEMNGE